MRQYFLPLGLLFAAIFAFTLPQAGVLLAEFGGISFAVFIIFLVSGYQSLTAGIPLNRGLFYVFLAATVISLLLAPLLGLAIGTLFRLPPALFIGLLVICAVPPTLSSGIVLTGISGGNTVLALLLTVSLNLTGILILPTVLHLCLKAGGPLNVTVDQGALFNKMLLLVLLPFAVGKLLRTVLQKQKVSSNWSYVNSSCVVLAVYISLAASGQKFFRTGTEEYCAAVCSVSLIHFLLLGLNALAAKMLRLNPEDSKALLFVASQKTLPVSLAVLAGLHQDTGNAVIVCLLFHFIQLFIDSILAARFCRREVAGKSQY